MILISKISIRFYDDKEVRAAWDDEKSKWWFSVLDIIGVLRDEDNYAKNRNYWKYLKAKLIKENNELVSVTNQLKLPASDGKKYLTDKINDREMFMKGVDYSYYYEQENEITEGESE